MRAVRLAEAGTGSLLQEMPEEGEEKMTRGPSWRGPMFKPANVFFGLLVSVSLLFTVTHYFHGKERPEIDVILGVIILGELLSLGKRR